MNDASQRSSVVVISGGYAGICDQRCGGGPEAGPGQREIDAV